MNKTLNARLQVLDKGRDYFRNILNDFSESQLHFVPESGHWNILQVVDHIVKVERQTLSFIQNFDFARKDEKVGLKQALNFLLLKMALKSNLKFKIPTKEVAPEIRSAPDVLAEWEKVRNELATFLHNFPPHRLQNFVFFHPRSGKLNIFQTLDFLIDHMKHHQQQINRISNSSRFPTS